MYLFSDSEQENHESLNESNSDFQEFEYKIILRAPYYACL